MNKLYREVSISERLPLKNSGVIGICDPADGLQQFYFQDGKFVDPADDYPMTVTAWLEEVKLPSDEEIKQEEYNNFIQSDRNHYFKDGFKTGANFILNKLKAK